jgi:hypothetical protein
VDEAEAVVAKRFRSVAAFLNERNRRMVAAAEAQALGYGGDSENGKLQMAHFEVAAEAGVAGGGLLFGLGLSHPNRCEARPYGSR